MCQKYFLQNILFIQRNLPVSDLRASSSRKYSESKADKRSFVWWLGSNLYFLFWCFNFSDFPRRIYVWPANGVRWWALTCVLDAFPCRFKYFPHFTQTPLSLLSLQFLNPESLRLLDKGIAPFSVTLYFAIAVCLLRQVWSFHCNLLRACWEFLGPSAFLFFLYLYSDLKNKCLINCHFEFSGLACASMHTHTLKYFKIKYLNILIPKSI